MVPPKVDQLLDAVRTHMNLSHANQPALSSGANLTHQALALQVMATPGPALCAGPAKTIHTSQPGAAYSASPTPAGTNVKAHARIFLSLPLPSDPPWGLLVRPCVVCHASVSNNFFHRGHLCIFESYHTWLKQVPATPSTPAAQGPAGLLPEQGEPPVQREAAHHATRGCSESEKRCFESSLAFLSGTVSTLLVMGPKK